MSLRLNNDQLRLLENFCVDFWARILLKDENHNCIFHAHSIVQLRSGPFSCNANIQKENPLGPSYWPIESSISLTQSSAEVAYHIWRWLIFDLCTVRIQKHESQKNRIFQNTKRSSRYIRGRKCLAEITASGSEPMNAVRGSNLGLHFIKD